VIIDPRSPDAFIILDIVLPPAKRDRAMKLVYRSYKYGNDRAKAIETVWAMGDSAVVRHSAVIALLNAWLEEDVP